MSTTAMPEIVMHVIEEAKNPSFSLHSNNNSINVPQGHKIRNVKGSDPNSLVGVRQRLYFK
jgi:hypothetical protein